MASERLRALYRKARKAQVGCVVGEHALSAYRAAKTLIQWDALESMGLVRLHAETDFDWEPGCDCGVKSCPSNNPESEAFGSIGEFCLPSVDDDGYWQADDDHWSHGGSVWGHVGYRDVLDWQENPYVLGIMSETIEAFRDAWKARVHVKRCPMCNQTIPAVA